MLFCPFPQKPFADTAAARASLDTIAVELLNASQESSVNIDSMVTLVQISSSFASDPVVKVA